MTTLVTLRGHGPVPAGYYTCRKSDCPARRNPSTGRFERAGSHYHPQAWPLGEPQYVFTCPRCGLVTDPMPLDVNNHPACGRCLPEAVVFMPGQRVGGETDPCCAWHHSHPNSTLSCTNE